MMRHLRKGHVINSPSQHGRLVGYMPQFVWVAWNCQVKVRYCTELLPAVSRSHSINDNLVKFTDVELVSGIINQGNFLLDLV